MNATKSLGDLAQIRAIMERSKKFLSLSPWAAIMAGIYALSGACLAYWEIYFSPVLIYGHLQEGLSSPLLTALFFIAFAVLILATGTGL